MATNVSLNNGGSIILASLPDECPFCHRKISPLVQIANSSGNTIRVVFLCPADGCKELFIAYYAIIKQGNGINSMNSALEGVSIGRNKSMIFHKSINEISPTFIEIFNQAFAAEQYQLLQICGVGYRKALEFLIKDFAIKSNPPEKESDIKKKDLGKVISEYIKDDTGSKIKIVSKKAVWLGNDETHYVRKWGTKDLGDLKNLIDLTLTMIQAESDFKELMTSMPDPVKSE
ncbi:MAG: hypothetical protein ACLQQ4_07935 [Bacteroidia bacterium]